jgi:copper oxidase (laccase) domain-containing protein
LAVRWRAVSGVAVTWLDEVHGTDVVVVEEAGQHAGVTADALVTRVAEAGLGIWVGDCAPVALVSAEGVVGAAHVGWRGLEAGVLARAIEVMRDQGARTVRALVGPCVHVECYEFGARDLERLARRFGGGCRGRTAWGTPALDMPAAIGAALTRVGVIDVSVHPACTACAADDYWSHRARGDAGRQGMAVWLEAAA